jgi:hypothetical protein
MKGRWRLQGYSIAFVLGPQKHMNVSGVRRMVKCVLRTL